MSEVAIRCEGLGKRYRIGPRERYYALRDTLAGALSAPFRGLSRLVNPRSADNHPRSNNTMWALKDVSFEIKEGEVVGIIGRNGAGKSTLLKILSRITKPTEGTAEIHGRVGSLLEVGTGFHPELTGRENIYLNGAILGMRKAEIGRKFDEIVAFAEVEKFIDTPVKHYSSGMYMRLAFAVAAHLEPDVFLVDEVLAVGDAAFQRKCLDKMGEVAKEGRTVLFVSHNMGAVQGLCKRALWIDSGQIRIDDLAHKTIADYLGGTYSRHEGVSVEQMPRLTGGNDIRLIGLELFDGKGQATRRFRSGDRMIMRFHFRVLDTRRRYFAIEWTICSPGGTRVLYGSSSPQAYLLIAPTDRVGSVECDIPNLPLTIGTYLINCLLSLPHQERIDEVEGAASFDVVSCDVYSTGFNVDHRLAFATVPAGWSVLSGAKSLLGDE